MFVTRAFTHLCNIIPDFTDNNLINIIRYGEDYYAASEINYINQIDPVTLETVGTVTYSSPVLTRYKYVLKLITHFLPRSRLTTGIILL